MREANAIELLDIQNFVKVKGYGGEPLQDILCQKYTIWGDQLLDVGRIFGLDLSPRTVIKHTEHKGKRVAVGANDITFNIYAGEVEDWECDRLEAEIDGGCLTFRTVYIHDGKATETDFTYNGRFMVHWVPEQRA